MFAMATVHATHVELQMRRSLDPCDLPPHPPPWVGAPARRLDVQLLPRALKAKVKSGLRDRHAAGRLVRSNATQGTEVSFLITSDQWQQRAIGALVPRCGFAAGRGVFI